MWSKNNFCRGQSFFDLGAESFKNIESIELYGGCKITDEEDIELFTYYNYSRDYPKDKLDGLKINTLNSVFIYIDGNRYPLCLSDEGCLIFFTDGSYTISKAKVYVAQNENGITVTDLEKWREKYQ